MFRSKTCGELRLTDAGTTVTLAGWVQRVRKMGGMVFVDLRDRYGITQLVFDDATDAALCEQANRLGREYVIQVTGKVSERSSKNSKIPTGDIEILVDNLNVINAADTPPFTIEDETDGGDDLRMKYRYLDLRRQCVRKNLELRHKMVMEIRKFLTDRIEFEIASYLNQVSQNEISEQARMQVKAYFKIIGELESLGDSGEAISRLLQRKRDHSKVFNELMIKRIDEMLDTMQNAYDVMNANLAMLNVSDISNAYQAEDAINVMRDRLREEHLKNMEVKSYDYTAGVYYFDLIQELETMGDFMINISQALVGLNV